MSTAGQRWRHRRRGTTYLEIATVPLMSGTTLLEGQWVVVFEGVALPTYPGAPGGDWIMAELQSEHPVAPGTSLVIYRAETDNKAWARPEAEFHDGRFERVP